MSHNPYKNASLYDFFTLDGTPHPGISWVEGDGERVEEFQDQQVPMTSGASTVFRFEPNGRISYAIKLWKAEHFPAWDAFVAKLNAGKAARPPKVWTLADARLADVQMTLVSFEKMGPRQVRRGGETVVRLTLKENRKQKPYGGAAAARDAIDPMLEQLSKETAAKKARLEAAQAAARAKK